MYYIKDIDNSNMDILLHSNSIKHHFMRDLGAEYVGFRDIFPDSVTVIKEGGLKTTYRSISKKSREPNLIGALYSFHNIEILLSVKNTDVAIKYHNDWYLYPEVSGYDAFSNILKNYVLD